MICPRCNTQLLMSDKHGVEIDYCPACRGIWLDRGELEKIMERELVMSSKNNQNTYREYDDHNDHRKYQNGNIDPNYKQKKRGFLLDLFDF